MNNKLIIAIDYDDTFTTDPLMWRTCIEIMQLAGHRVVCVSARRDTFEHRQILVNALPENVAVYLSYDAPKRMYCLSKGIEPDIWIEDRPYAVDNPA